MILPGAGFDVVATDCLALHLKGRLPSANRLALAFHSDGPAGLPPGTFKAMVDGIPDGINIRQDGKIIRVSEAAFRLIDFGGGPVRAVRFTWGDVYTA
jgi:short subunit dehydrogenase-like uncharacterized protein